MVTLCAVLTGLCKIQHSLLKHNSKDQPIFTAINNLLPAEHVSRVCRKTRY